MPGTIVSFPACSRVSSSHFPEPTLGPEQSSILAHLDTAHPCTDLLKLHADLTVPDVAETGRVKEGEERAGRTLAKCSIASALVAGHQVPVVT